MKCIIISLLIYLRDINFHRYNSRIDFNNFTQNILVYSSSSLMTLEIKSKEQNIPKITRYSALLLREGKAFFSRTHLVGHNCYLSRARPRNCVTSTTVPQRVILPYFSASFSRGCCLLCSRDGDNASLTAIRYTLERKCTKALANQPTDDDISA